MDTIEVLCMPPEAPQPQCLKLLPTLPSNLGWTPSKAQWSKFLGVLLSTDEADTFAPTFDKICVFARQYDNIEGWFYFLYCIDLSSACKNNDDSIYSLHPILKIMDGNYHDYVVVGCELYMFGGMDSDDFCWSDKWCCYDFSDAVYSPTTTFIDDQRLRMGSRMKGIKIAPIAAVVGGHMICVFSTIIYAKKEKVPDQGSPNFEVLDTRHKSWIVLPEPESNYSKYEFDAISIKSYCIDGSCLIICADIGIYGINVCSENPIWVRMDGSERIKTSPLCGRWTLIGENVCTAFKVAKWGQAQSCPFSFDNKGSLSFRSDEGLGVICSERVKNGVILCSVRGRIPPITKVPGLFVNVVKLDSKLLENLGGAMWNTIQTDKSCIFEIKYQKCDCMELMGIFDFKESENVAAVRKKALEEERRSKKKNVAAVRKKALEDERRSKKKLKEMS